MKRELIMLPESYPVVKRLLDLLFSSNGVCFDLIILEKQREGLARLIENYNFNAIYFFKEEYYGAVTDNSTKSFIANKVKEPYDAAIFPFNNFPANAFLFGSVIAKEVRAVNSSLYGKRADTELPRVSFSLYDNAPTPAFRVPWSKDMEIINKNYREIVKELKEVELKFDITGERPSVGIIDGFAYDIERYCGYAFASSYSKGKKVLDIGGGVGFGSFLLSSFADSVTFFDQSKGTVAFVDDLWRSLRPNIKAVCGDANHMLTGADMEAGSFDVVVMMDVIEHFRAPEDVLKSIKDLLCDDGVLILSTPEPELAPYTVCPEERWGDTETELLSEAIWPWHLQSLGEEALLALLNKSGFTVVEKSYSTYAQGYKLKENLLSALLSKEPGSLVDSLLAITDWKVSDFALTDERDPYFSNYSYNIVAGKGSL